MQSRSSALWTKTLILVLALSTFVLAQGDAHVSLDPNGNHSLTVNTAFRALAIRQSQSPITDAVSRAIPGTDGVAVSWTELEFTGPQPWYAISLDGRTVDVVSPTRYDVRLRYATFDPLNGRPAVPAHLTADRSATTWIVQNWTQGLEEYRHDMRRAGATIHNHLWHHANIVEMDATTATNIGARPYVRSVVPFHPAYKLDEQLSREQAIGFSVNPVKRVNIASLRRGLSGQGPIAQRIDELGGQVHLTDPDTYQMRVTLSLGQIAAIAHMDEVHFIEVEAPGRDTADMDIGRQFHGSLYVDNVGGFDGAGVRAEISDTGIDTAHPEFAARPVIPHGGLSSGSHGTSVYGQLFASGVNAQAKGAAYMGQGIGNSAGSWAGGTEYNHTSELSNPNLVYKAVLQTFSGFSPLTTQYTTVAAPTTKARVSGGTI